MPKRYARFIRFGAVGGSGVVVNMVTLAITYHALSIPLALASIIAIQCAIITNFTGHHLFTFRGTHGSLLKRFVTFETISISTAALSWAVLNGLALTFGTQPPLIVYAYNLIAIAVSFVANYTLNASSTWKDHEPARSQHRDEDSVPEHLHEVTSEAKPGYDPYMLNVHGRRVSGIAALVIAAGLITHLLLRLAPLPDIPGIYLLRDLIDPNAEQSAITWISSVLWLIAAVASVVIANTRNALGESDVRWWFAFAVIPLAISLDEVAAMHERLSEPIRARLVLDGSLYFAWVIPATIIVLALGVTFSRFVLRLPSWLRLRIVMAGGVAIAGAIGLELVGSAVFRMDEYGRQSVEYLVVTTLEEALELAGVLILISALLRYVALHTRHTTIQLVGYPEDGDALSTQDDVRVDR